MSRKSLKELKELILKDMECGKKFLNDEYISKSNNPQVVEMKLKAQARLDAMEDVLVYVTKGGKYGFRKE